MLDALTYQSKPKKERSINIGSELQGNVKLGRTLTIFWYTKIGESAYQPDICIIAFFHKKYNT